MDVKGVELDNKRTKEETGTPIGTEAWDSTTQLINGDDLGIISEVCSHVDNFILNKDSANMAHQYDTKASKFSQFVKVEHDKAFVLKPVRFSQEETGEVEHFVITDTDHSLPSHRDLSKVVTC